MSIGVEAMFITLSVEQCPDIKCRRDELTAVSDWCKTLINLKKPDNIDLQIDMVGWLENRILYL